MQKFRGKIDAGAHRIFHGFNGFRKLCNWSRWMADWLIHSHTNFYQTNYPHSILFRFFLSLRAGRKSHANDKQPLLSNHSIGILCSEVWMQHVSVSINIDPYQSIGIWFISCSFVSFFPELTSFFFHHIKSNDIIEHFSLALWHRMLQTTYSTAENIESISISFTLIPTHYTNANTNTNTQTPISDNKQHTMESLTGAARLNDIEYLSFAE